MGPTGPGRERAPRGAAGPFVARVLRRYPGIILELRTARANGVPHSTIRRGRNPRKWTQTDRILALALTVHEDGLCPKCGQPRDRSWNEDMDGYYRVHRATCLACGALHLSHDDAKPNPSETRWVTDDSPPGYEPDARMAHKG